ncbi:AbgT family transporter [candidate division KSB1 bacterium]|nr:AbgT family transporter [candidate division KSB1 bacterium]
MKKAENKNTFFTKSIQWVEKVGNYLPHPFFLFLILIIGIFIISFFLSLTGLETTYTTVDPVTNEQTTKQITVINLFDKSIVQSMMSNFVTTFIYFAPVGFVIIMIIGVGLAEQTGFFSAIIRLIIKKTPRYLITFILAILSICANIASDAGIIIAPAIGAAVFLALGRHPIAGVCTGYVAAYGGYSANIFVAGTDVVLAGITESAIKHFNIAAVVHPLMNWYVMMGSTLLLATVVTFVTERIVIPFLGEYDPPEEYKLKNNFSRRYL